MKHSIVSVPEDIIILIHFIPVRIFLSSTKQQSWRIYTLLWIINHHAFEIHFKQWRKFYLFTEVHAFLFFFLKSKGRELLGISMVKANCQLLFCSRQHPPWGNRGFWITNNNLPSYIVSSTLSVICPNSIDQKFWNVIVNWLPQTPVTEYWLVISGFYKFRYGVLRDTHFPNSKDITKGEAGWIIFSVSRALKQYFSELVIWYLEWMHAKHAEMNRSF